MSTSKINQVPYHHGDLRNALVAAGVEMVATEGEQGLSMRKLAKRAGVSHNAPYMHFTDKEALLAAIAEEGFHLLTDAVQAAVAAAGNDWYEQLLAGSQAYVHFALDYPSHFRMMFRAYEVESYPALAAASSGALETLRALVEAGQRSQVVINGDSKQLATMTWSLLHGIATILAVQKMPPDVMGERTSSELVRDYLGLLYHGLTSEPGAAEKTGDQGANV